MSRVFSRQRVLLVTAAVGLWLLLTDGDPASWLVGVPVIALALAYGERVAGPAGTPLSLVGILLFIPFFLRESLLGGIDVARRVLAYRPRVQPGFARYPLSLRSAPARVLFANTVSLLPGTLTVEMRDQEIELHALDMRGDYYTELARLERAVGRVFGEVH